LSALHDDASERPKARRSSKFAEAPEGTVRPGRVPEDAIQRVIRVPPEFAGTRLDVFVKLQLRNTSRTRARAIIKNSAFSPEGIPLRHNSRVQANQYLILWRPRFEEEVEETPLAILFEDDWLLVVDKPPFVAVHPTARYYHSTLIKRLEVQRPNEFFSLVHRLDRETSGLVLIAKTRASERAFKRLLEDRSVQAMVVAENETYLQMRKSERLAFERRARTAQPVRKTYLALTWGTPPNGTIDTPLEVDTDNPLRVKMRLAPKGTGLEARTDVSVLETRGRYALISCELHTGRQHQIRLHLASLGCPVVGDKLYGPNERFLARAADKELTDEDLRLLELPRHALHAHRYEMPHPFTDQNLVVMSPLAADLELFFATASSEAESMRSAPAPPTTPGGSVTRR
jgi:23S rRNA pseudouridine1911/1915/1917 synthase